MGKLNALTSLNLSGCVRITMLPDEIAHLSNLTKLNLSGCSQLTVLPVQIGQLQTLTELLLSGCSGLKELPATVAHLGALGTLDIEGCDNLALALGTQLSTPAKAIVAAYASHLIVEPHKSTPQLKDLLTFLEATPLNKQTFFKFILTNASHADWLGEAVKAEASLADLTDTYGRRAIDLAQTDCRKQMQAAIYLLGRFNIDKVTLLHRSATAAVAAAADHANPEAKPVPVALKAMSSAKQVCAELEGRVGLDPKNIITVVTIFADQQAVDTESWGAVLAAAGRLGVRVECTSSLSTQIKQHFSAPKELAPSGLLLVSNAADVQLSEKNSLARIVKGAMKKMSNRKITGEYPYLLVMQLADRTLLHTIDHEHFAGEDFPAIRHIVNNLASALDDMHDQGKGGIHADFKPLNAVGDRDTWKIIDFDVFCKVGQPFGNKAPSSGYCPPEFARVLLRAMNDQGEVDGAKLCEYMASVAYDLWSFGVVLYQLCFGRPLWLTDINDNVTPEDLRILASEPDLPLRRALDKALNKGEIHSAKIELKAAAVLLRKLLEPDEKKRLDHFYKADSSMRGVLEEPFFQTMDVDGATVQEINAKVDRIERHALKLIDMSEENLAELLLTRKVAPSSPQDATFPSSVHLRCLILMQCTQPYRISALHLQIHLHRCCSRASSRRPRCRRPRRSSSSTRSCRPRPNSPSTTSRRSRTCSTRARPGLSACRRSARA